MLIIMFCLQKQRLLLLEKKSANGRLVLLKDHEVNTEKRRL